MFYFFNTLFDCLIVHRTEWIYTTDLIRTYLNTSLYRLTLTLYKKLLLIMSRKITQVNNKRYKKKYDNMLKKMSHFKIILLHMMCIIHRYQFEFILKQQYSSNTVFFNPTCKKGICRKRSVMCLWIQALYGIFFFT